MTAQEIFNVLVEQRRGNSAANVFLHPNYTKDQEDPWLLTDMKKAVTRLKQAQENSERVVVYGDYDIDGLTASTILLDAGRAWGLDISAHIPNRFTDGYGLNPQSIRVLAEQKTDLIVTVDCGSLSIDEVSLANDFGMDVIITDHHAVGDILPDAIAVINPKRSDSKYPHQNLAGVGVAYKLIQAAMGELSGLEVGQEKWMLDLVALGTVCDVVPLTGENRTLVSWGVQVARKQRRVGLRALCEVSGVYGRELKSVDMAFKLGPRLNASGRLESARISLDLLNTRSEIDGLQLAYRLDQLNADRRVEQESITRAALQMAEKNLDPVLILAHEDWSHGIIGIVASKLVQQLHKPAIVMQKLEDTIKGSARSFGDFRLHEAVEAVRDLLISGGGHSYAAGFTIYKKDFEEFKKRINDFYRSLDLSDQDDAFSFDADIEVESAEVLSDELVSLLEQLEPFGEQNPSPLFKLKDVTLSQLSKLGASGKHCRGLLVDSSGSKQPFVHFNNAEELYSLAGSSKLDCIIRLEKNWFKGSAQTQRQLVNWEIAN